MCPQNFLSWLPDERVLAPLVLFPSSWLGGPWEGTSGAAGEPCPGRVWCPCGAGPGAVGADKAWTCEESPVPGLEGEAGLDWGTALQWHRVGAPVPALPVPCAGLMPSRIRAAFRCSQCLWEPGPLGHRSTSLALLRGANRVSHMRSRDISNQFLWRGLGISWSCLLPSFHWGGLGACFALMGTCPAGFLGGISNTTTV